MVLWLLLALSASAGDLVVAVNYFDAHSIRPELEPLGRGAADMLTTDLARASQVRVVERVRLAQVLDELALAKSGFIDPESAQRLGAGLGADVVVVGAITVAIEGMRLDARAIDVATGQVRASAQATGASEDFFKLEAEVARLLLEGLGVPAQVGERPLPLAQILDGARAIDEADAAIVARLTALREYKQRRLVRLAAGGGWAIFEGGVTPLSGRAFAERTGDTQVLAQMDERARGGKAATWGLLVGGAALTVGGVVLTAQGFDPALERDESAQVGFITGGVGVATLGVVGLSVSAWPAMEARATQAWPGHSYTPEAADGRIRAYNDALAASLGVSRADALQLDVSGR